VNRNTVEHHRNPAEYRRDHDARRDQFQREMVLPLSAALIIIVLSSVALWWAILSVVWPLISAVNFGLAELSAYGAEHPVRAGRPQMFCVLDDAGLLSEKMALGNTTLVSTVLIAAGVYQWTPLNNTCPTHCRSPTELMIRHWDPRSFGAVRTGLRNGLFLGSCWMLRGASVRRRIDEARLGRPSASTTSM
jgi:hypothetical protein